MRTAVVFSAGGMFGAWQVGAWKVLSDRLQPGLVVGASIGSLNGWAVAGGCPPAELARYWLDLGAAGRLKFRLPRSPLDGCLDASGFESAVASLYSAYRPRTDYALVATDLFRLRPHIFPADAVTVRHLLASCAVPVFLKQQRIGERIYSDGGLLNALPVWAAVELGAARVVALDALPFMPSATVRMFGKMLRAVVPQKPAAPGPGVVLAHLTPGRPLGPAVRMMTWDKDRIAGWISQGERDAQDFLAANKTFLSELS